jgi:hypothetical protein
MAKLHKQKKRTVIECESCHRRAALAGDGLCYRCYRREERAAGREEDLRDPNSVESRRRRKHLLGAFQALMGGLLQLGIEDTLLMDIREQLRPYFAEIGPLVGYAADSTDEEEEVNNKHKTTFTSGKKQKSKTKNSDRHTVEEETAVDEDEDEGGADDESEE